MLNSVSLITGAGRGIGREIALHFASLGSDVMVNDVNASSAEEVADLVRKAGRKAAVSTHDVSSHEAAQQAVAACVEKLGRVDALINNAGITRDAMLHKLPIEKWDEVIRVNLTGPFNMGQACASVMMEQKKGAIVNLSSVAWLGNMGQTNYSAAKAGVVGLTRTWALELAKYGIRVNAIAPGFIDTVLTQQVPQEIRERFVQRIPLKRMGATGEIAKLAAFLVGDASSYITGVCIPCDGGLTVGVSA